MKLVWIPYSGLVDMFEKQGLLVKDGNRLKYVNSAGEETKEYRKNWSGELLNMVMSDYINKSILRGKYSRLQNTEPRTGVNLMERSSIVDVWNTFKDSIDKKQIEIVAEKFVDTCADYGAQDTAL